VEKCGYGDKIREESSTGRVWAAGSHHVAARSRLTGVLKFMNRLFFFLIFQVSFRAAVNREYGGPPVLNCVAEDVTLPDTSLTLYQSTPRNFPEG